MSQGPRSSPAGAPAGVPDSVLTPGAAAAPSLADALDKRLRSGRALPVWIAWESFFKAKITRIHCILGAENTVALDLGGYSRSAAKGSRARMLGTHTASPVSSASPPALCPVGCRTPGPGRRSDGPASTPGPRWDGGPAARTSSGLVKLGCAGRAARESGETGGRAGPGLPAFWNASARNS